MRQLRDQKRNAALRALPLPLPELDAMFDMLSLELPSRECDHTQQLTRAWLAENGHDIDVVLAWLELHRGFCDCEILMNVEPHVEEAKAGSRTAPD